MTFTQLRTFALVAELGSLRAAAAALGVSEPAVSAAVAALRTDLGDPLFRRTGSGIALTPGGRALAARARELVRLADRTRREVGATATSTAAACGCWRPRPAPSTSPARWSPRSPGGCRGAAVDLTVGSTDCAATALAEDVADIVLGVRPAPGRGPAGRVGAVPALRAGRRRRPGPPARPAPRLGGLADLAGYRG